MRCLPPPFSFARGEVGLHRRSPPPSVRFSATTSRIWPDLSKEKLRYSLVSCCQHLISNSIFSFFFCNKMRGRLLLVGSSASPLPSLITRNLTTVTSDHSSSPPGSPFLYSKRVLLIDTLGMVRKLEAKHVPSNQAEAIISAMSELLSDSLEDVAQFFVSKGEMHKSEMIQDSNLLKVKSEVQSSQDRLFSLLQGEIGTIRGDIGTLRCDNEKLGCELRSDNEKLSCELRAQITAAKYDVTKYFIGTIVSVFGVGLGIIHFFSNNTGN